MKKLFLLLFFPILVGCTLTSLSVIGGVTGLALKGYVTWKKNEATKYYFADANILCRAVENSAKDLNLPITKTENKKGVYYINVGEKDKFKIEVTQVEKDISKVWIRINFLGNKPYAELFYKKIDENLNVINFDHKKTKIEPLPHKKRLRLK